MLLSDYQTNVQQILNDPFAQFYNTVFLTNWINRARTYVANMGQCIRFLTPSSGSVAMVTVTATGSGYTTATVTISGPDAIGGLTFTQATATATLTAGAVTSIAVVVAGTGYVANPTVTITGDGVGATATATLTSFVQTVANQEVYPFSTFNTLIQGWYPGASSIIGVQSISASWGADKPTLDWTDFSSFQAYNRAWNYGQNYPAVWSQYGQGATGSVYLFPIPSQTLQMEWDCWLSPLPLSATQTADLIPDPWTEPVFYYAAYLAYLNAQRKDDANAMLAEFKRTMVEARQFVTPPRIPTMYPSGED